MSYPENDTEKNEHQVVIPEQTEQEYLLESKKLLLIKDLKGCGKVLILIGGLSILFSGFLSATWGVILILLGIFTIFVIEPTMYIVLGTVIFMLGISNSVSSSVGWSIFSLIQLVIGFYVFKGYFKYRDYYDSIEGKTFKFMVLSLMMLLVSIVCITASFLSTFEIIINSVKISQILIQITLYTSILGTSFGLASVFSENAFKPLSIIVMLLNIIVFLFYIGLFIFGFAII